MKTLCSRLVTAAGTALMLLLAVPASVFFGLICLVHTAVDRLTSHLER